MLRLQSLMTASGLALTVGHANAEIEVLDHDLTLPALSHCVLGGRCEVARNTNYQFGSYGRGKHVYCPGYFMANPTSPYKWCDLPKNVPIKPRPQPHTGSVPSQQPDRAAVTTSVGFERIEPHLRHIDRAAMNAVLAAIAAEPYVTASHADVTALHDINTMSGPHWS